MNRPLLIIILGCMLYLVGCTITINGIDGISSEPTANPKTTEKEGKQAKEEENKEEKEQKEKEEDKEEQQEDQGTNDTDIPKDLAGVFNKMIEASHMITSVSITAKAETNSIISGFKNMLNTEIKGELTFNPFVQHIVSTVISGEGDSSEMYMNEDGFYIYSSDGGWTKMDSAFLDNSIFNILQENQLKHFIDHIDKFELKDDGDYFTITYIGNDEMFQEVIYAEEMYTDSFFSQFDELRGSIEITGEIEMKVSKETYLVDEQEAKIKSISNQGIKMEQTDHTISSYIYNMVDEIIIPEEVIKNARSM